MSFRAVVPQPRQQIQAQHIYQECSSAIGTDELEMPLGPGTSRTGEEEEEECILYGLTGGGVCPSRSWDACYPLTVDEWSRTMNQREEVSNDVSRGHEMEQDVADSFLYSDEYLPSGDNFSGAGQQVLPQSLQAEEEFEQGSGGVNGFCFGAYETDSSEGVAVWSPEQDVPDLAIPLPDGSDEWIHESYLDDRTASEGPGSGGSFEWGSGSTGRTGSANGAESSGSQGWQDEYSDGSSSSASMWKRSIWKDIETSHQSFQDKEQQQRLYSNGEDGSVLGMQQEMDIDLIEAATMTTVGLIATATTSTVMHIAIRKTNNTHPIYEIKSNRVRVHNRTATRLDPRTVGRAGKSVLPSMPPPPLPLPQPLPPPSSSPFTQRSVYGSSRTSRILRATELIHENVSKNTISSKRDMYYRDVMAFGSQTAVDGIVEDLACTFEVPRSSLNVVAGTRSVVFGSVRMLVKALGRQKSVAVDDSGGEDSGASEQLLWLQEEIANSPFSKTQTLSNSLMTKEHGEGEEEEEDDPLDSRFSQTSYNTLVPIPIRFSDIVEIEIHPRTRFVLVIEKEATLSNLISLGFCETHGPCILLTGKGFPDQVARQLLKALSEMVLDGIPLVALMDCDPHGIEIYLTYRCGSINSAYENANLAVPALKCLGQCPSDWDLFLDSRPVDALSDGKPPQGQEQDGENDEKRETMRLRARFKEMLIPLTAKDRTKLERLITTHPYICQHARWRDQIEKMLEVDAKTEIQSLHLLDYSSAGSGASVAVGGNEGEIGGGGNIRGAEEGGELAAASSSALVLYLQRKLQDPESWL
ncbi:endodeoxyribonuclease [Mortierella sp. GBA39]|nr:endodeoxyribonuclease [Mortierella sp. GBA39]